MKIRHFIFLLQTITLLSSVVWGQTLVHPAIGTQTISDDTLVTLHLVHKMQQYDWRQSATMDKDIYSPKSVNIHPDGSKFYVNSLEGGSTVVYEMGTWKKLKTIHHRFGAAHKALWAPPSGLFPFTHYSEDSLNINAFMGKPVESTFSHGGRYLWVPYYRRSYDLNAQDPSALAVIDTRTDSIIRLMETGPLPKMIVCSHKGNHIAVTHWGDNTVAIIDASSDNPEEWHYEKLYIIDYQLELNFSLTTSIDRDKHSGYLLRGTVFTPDDHYLLVGCMGGPGGIGVIDLQKKEYLGRVMGMRTNTRHLLIQNGWLYLSSNNAGVIQRIRLDQFLKVLPQMENHLVTLNGWEECKVMPGARTIGASPSGNFIFAACNVASRLCVVDTRTMKLIASAEVDSYPVGLDISADGTTVITTSQGRNHAGGNAVDVFQVEYLYPEKADTLKVQENSTGTEESDGEKHATAAAWPWLLLAAGSLLAVAAGIIVHRVRRRKTRD